MVQRHSKTDLILNPVLFSGCKLSKIMNLAFNSMLVFSVPLS